ncbi:hypothetical protein LBU54_14505 [Winogradskyella sp. D23]|uniref:Uncharacterized protein n=2 Tax=Winogradskyella alexanderae TaxID=2877123 RepID=A0ABS7XXU0_9FLAO|nr:hypothetical protein [Winogradskyella alexanderae]
MGKYFKYAIGEIILVVIGILIALQINNWNENRKELYNEAKVLKTLNDEFLENKITLDSTLVLLNTTADALSFVLDNIDKTPIIDITPVQLDSVLFSTIANPYWKKSEYTLRNLENSGQLSSLSNQKLKTKLYEYSLALTDIEDKDSDATIAFNQLLNYFKINGSLRNLDANGINIREGRTRLDYNHISFFSDIVFENSIDDCLVYIRQRIQRYTKAKAIILEIISITNNSND